MTREAMTRSVPDLLNRWVPVSVQRMFRLRNGSGFLEVSIRTNSDVLFRSLILLQQGELYNSKDQSDFLWEIVLQTENAETVGSSADVSVLSAETMCTAYFGQKSFFSITPQRRYAAGFLSLPADAGAAGDLVDQYLALLVHLTRESTRAVDSDRDKEYFS